MGKCIFTAAATLANVLPAPVCDFIASACALCHFAISPEKRRAVRANLSGAGLAPRSRFIYGIFRMHALNVVDMIASSRWGREALQGRFDFEGRAELDGALGEGKGVVLVTQHTGSWETAAVYLQSLGYRLHVVAGVQFSTLLTGAVKEAKEKLGIEVINPEDPPRRLLRALSSGGILALLVDGNIYTAGVETKLFGKRVMLPEGPVRLARTAGAPIVAGYCRRLPQRRYRIHVERLLSGEEAVETNEKTAFALVYAAVERFLAENADQWVLFRRFWGVGR